MLPTKCIFIYWAYSTLSMPFVHALISIVQLAHVMCSLQEQKWKAWSLLVRDSILGTEIFVIGEADIRKIFYPMLENPLCLSRPSWPRFTPPSKTQIFSLDPRDLNFTLFFSQLFPSFSVTVGLKWLGESRSKSLVDSNGIKVTYLRGKVSDKKIF